MRRAAPLLLVGCAALAGCGGDGHASLRVLAAASLTDAFAEVAAAFEADHPNLDVELSFGASSALREQVLEGAPGDILATADTETMDVVAMEGAVLDPVPFAANTLEIAVPPGNPGSIAGLGDFADEALVLGLCAEQVPCGRLARRALDRAGVRASIDTVAANVRGVLTQVRSGDLDAGIVYRTDVLAAGGEVEGVPIPPEENVVATYPIARLRSGSADATAFIEFVLSSDGQAILSSFGFLPR